MLTAIWRRQRRLRAMLRHERQTVAMELAAALHHSRDARSNDVHAALRGQMTASSGTRPEPIRTCQRNTRRLSAVTASSRKWNRWMMRKLLWWQRRRQFLFCKVGSTNRKLSGASLESRKRSNRNRRNVWKSCDGDVGG